MNEEKDREGTPPAEPPASGGPPFDAFFFTHIFPERVRALCQEQPQQVPVVAVHLADGAILDLCHIAALTPAWMAVAAYRDTATCAEMDTVFVPYGLIMRITVSAWPPSRRRLGFRLTEPPAAAPASEREASDLQHRGEVAR